MSDHPEIRAARDSWDEIINNRFKCQDSQAPSLSDSLMARLQEKGLSQDVLDIIEYWKLKISAGSLKHYGVREGRRRMESKYEWGVKDYRLVDIEVLSAIFIMWCNFDHCRHHYRHYHLCFCGAIFTKN